MNTILNQAQRKKRVAQITLALIEGQVEAGTLDQDDDQAMDFAVRQAVRDATALYDAAVEYVS